MPVPLFSPASKRGVKTRRQRRRYARLEVVCRRQTRGNQFRRLSRVILPVVVRSDKRSIAVAQLQRWIGQRISHSKCRQAGADTAHHDPVIAVVTAQHEARDHDVVPCADKGSRANIGQLRRNCLTEVVNFNQATPEVLFLPRTIAV